MPLDFIALPILIVCAFGLACVVSYLRWIYLMGIMGAAGFLYLTLILRRFEIALVAHLAGLLIIVDALTGSWPFYGTSIYYSDFILVALLLTFLAPGRYRDRGYAEVPNHEQSDHLVRLFLIIYVISFLASTIVHGLPMDVRSWISFALEGYILFNLTVRILRDGNRLRSFAIALLLFGLVISLNENSKALGYPGFIRWRWDSTYSVLSGAESNKVGLVANIFAPAMGWPSRAGAFFISLLPLATRYALQKGRAVLRALSAIMVLSLILNLIALRDRGSWLACGLSLFFLTLFSSRRRQYVMAIATAGSLASLALVLTGRLGYAGGYASLGDWIFGNFASDVRLRILRGILPAHRRVTKVAKCW